MGRFVRRMSLLMLCGLSLAGCATSQNGTIKGRLEFIGGPPQVVNGIAETRRVPIPGVVYFVGKEWQRYSVRVPESGRFSIDVTSGTYSVTGGPSQWDFRGCVAGAPVVVGAGQIERVLVLCPVV